MQATSNVPQITHARNGQPHTQPAPKTFPQRFDNFLDAVQSILMSFLAKLGPFFVALMPALFTAYSIFHTFKNEAGSYLALFFAVVVGLAMETVGIVATHTAIDLYNAKEAEIINPGKFQLMVWLVLIYVIGVAAVVGFSEDAFTPLVKGLGIASPFLTCIVYIAVALARDLIKIETKQNAIDEQQVGIEAEDRAWQREKERLEMELKHKEKLARIAAKRNNQAVKNNVFDTVNQEREERKLELQTRMLDIYSDDPNAKAAMVADDLQVSRQTVYNYLEELEKAGKINRNGQGVKVAK